MKKLKVTTEPQEIEVVQISAVELGEAGATACAMLMRDLLKEIGMKHHEDTDFEDCIVDLTARFTHKLIETLFTEKENN